jgi:Tfp pilus assembly protein PilX
MMRSNEKQSASENRDRTTGRAALPANEQGSVVVLALIMLMMLTLVGTSATTTSTLEIQVAGNERHYKQNFYKAEAAASRGSQLIEDSGSYTETWMRSDTFAHTWNPRTNFDTIGNWQGWSDNTYTLVIYTGIAPWSSLDMTSPTQVRAFSVYGQLQNLANNESLIIETGFAKRM